MHRHQVLALDLKPFERRFGLLGGGEEAKSEKQAVVEPVFYDLPDFLVNLSGDAPQHFLKMKVTLQITDAEAAKRLDAEMPRILDAFQMFLRELRPEDVEGSAGMLRVKEELMRRINLAVQPPVVTDILFREPLAFFSFLPPPRLTEALPEASASPPA